VANITKQALIQEIAKSTGFVRNDIKTVIEGAEKGWTTKKATADNTDEEDETNTPQGGGNNPDDGMLG